MFEKKQVIFSETQGVCRVENIVQLSADKNKANRVSYYVLRSLDSDRTAYIPVEHHQVKLREMFSREEAQAIMDDPKASQNDLLVQAAKYVLAGEA